jgi:iron complex transport system ATP-binding protein
MFKISNYNLYQSKRLLVDNITFSIKEGEVLYIVGNNGVGKSTLLKTIANNNFSNNDNVFLNSTSAHLYNIKEWIDRVKLLNQQHTVVFDILVKDFLLMAFRSDVSIFENFTHMHSQYINEIAHELKIDSLLNKPITELSGGEQQLCWLAQIMLQKPRLLLLDEPTQFLDVSNRKMFFNFLTKYCKDNNISCLCASHDLMYNTNNHQEYLLV